MNIPKVLMNMRRALAAISDNRTLSLVFVNISRTVGRRQKLIIYIIKAYQICYKNDYIHFSRIPNGSRVIGAKRERFVKNHARAVQYGISNNI